MKNLYRIPVVFLFISILMMACADPFGVTDLFCTSVTRCLNGKGFLSRGQCICVCDEGFCGARCGFDKSTCKGTVISNFEAEKCECVCPSLGGISFEPPQCEKLTVSLTAFELPVLKNNSTNDINYFPLNWGNSWTYSVLDTTEFEANQFGLIVKNFIARNDTNYIAIDLMIPDSTGVIVDTVAGPLFFSDPSDSTMLYQLDDTGNADFFISQHLNFGDTLSVEIDEFSGDTLFTVVDSIGQVIVPADTFENCVFLRNQDNSGMVLAPYVGLVAVIDDGRFSTVLTDVTLSCATRLEVKISGTRCYSTDDGSIDIEEIGEQIDLDYSWSGPTNIGNESHPRNLTAGLYYLTVSNDRCRAIIEEIPIIQADSISITLDEIIQPDCNQNNGSIAISVSGGQSPYWYSWNDGTFSDEDIQNLSSGCYELEIMDDNGCTKKITVDLISEETIELNASIQNASCHDAMDGTIELEISGGESPYEIHWDDGNEESERNNLESGDYSVTVTDALGCNDTLNVFIDQPEQISIALDAVMHLACNSDFTGGLDITVIGGNGDYSFDWNNGLFDTEDLTGLWAGSYALVVTDENGCTVQTSFMIDEPEELLLSLSSTPSDAGLDNGTVLAMGSGGTGNYTYMWDDDASRTGNLAENLPPGDYNVSITDDNGCTTTATITVDIINSIAENILEEKITIYPNPCPQGTDLNIAFDVSIQSGSFKYTLINTNGQRIWNGNSSKIEHQTITTNKLEKGSYYLVIEGEGSVLVVNKLVVM